MQFCVERDVPVPMRDGVVLRADVYRPSEDGKYPALLSRIPYNKSSAQSTGAPMVNPIMGPERGYVIVVQDTRGRFTSDGKFVPFFTEAEDGYDTVEWVAKQEWCNGEVGIYGNSYLGVTVRQAVVANPPHLKAAVAYLTGANYHQGWTYTGGAFELGFNHRWAIKLALGAVSGLAESEREMAKKHLNYAAAHLHESMSYLPHRNAPGLERELVSYYQDWLDHPTYDEYWESIDATQKASDVSAPTLDITGWQDLFSRGHIDMYNALKENGKEIPKNEQRLLIGPWAHESYMGYANDRVGDKVFGPIASSAAGFVGPFIFAWFDAWLKGETEKLKELPLVRYFDIGSREWTNADTWPPEGRDIRYYLHSAGQANTRFGNGTLLLDTPDTQSPDSYQYDPLDPVPTKGGRIQMPEVQEAGVKDQSVIEEREDVLVYTTPYLDKAVKIAGPVEARLFVSSSAVDTDFTAKLVDVEPNGYCGNVTEGILRARYRDSMKQVDFMEPGEVYEIFVDLWHVAHTFKPGHKIRLEISSSSFPRWDRNSNTEIQPCDATVGDMQIATNTIYHESEKESSLSLHVVE